MARVLSVTLVLLSTFLFADDGVAPLPGLSCAVGTEALLREEADSAFQFCALRAGACPVSDNIENLEVMVDGKKLCRIASGPARFLNADKSRVEMNYEQGLLEGVSTTFSQSGKKILEEGYHRGVKMGMRVAYDQATGNKLSEERYRDGLRDGLAEFWYANSKPKSSVRYKMGRRDGKYQEWYPNGLKRLSALYQGGKWQGQFTEYYSNGAKRLEAHLSQGMFEGDFALWYSTGKRMSERSYTKGLLNGLFKEWDASGTLVTDSRYENGKLEKFTLLLAAPGMRRISSTQGAGVLNPTCAEVQSVAAIPKGQIRLVDAEPVCTRLDLDSNGYADYVFSPAQAFTQSHVVLMRSGEVIQKLEIEDANLSVFPINPFEGDFGEPAAFHEGLVSRGEVTKVYLYNFDTRQFDVSHHASE